MCLCVCLCVPPLRTSSSGFSRLGSSSFQEPKGWDQSNWLAELIQIALARNGTGHIAGDKSRQTHRNHGLNLLCLASELLCSVALSSPSIHPSSASSCVSLLLYYPDMLWPWERQRQREKERERGVTHTVDLVHDVQTQTPSAVFSSPASKRPTFNEGKGAN